MSIFASFEQPKVACIFVLDCSVSMTAKIGDNDNFTYLEFLHDAIKVLEHKLKKDYTLAESVDIAVIQVADQQAELIQDWTVAEDFIVPTIVPKSSTALTSVALLQAIEMCEQRKKYYQHEGIDYYRPWIVIISDGKLADSSTTWQNAVDIVQIAIHKRKVFTMAVAINDNCPTVKLQQVSYDNIVLPLYMFGDTLVWRLCPHLS